MGVSRVWVLMALVVAARTGDAQRPVGALREVRGFNGCPADGAVRRAPNDAVRVSRGPGGFVEITTGQVVSVRDQVEVKRLVDAKIFSAGAEGFGRGVIVFAPELGTCTEYAGAFQRRGRRLGGSRPGSYAITTRSERRGGRDSTRLIIALEYGGLVVDWQGGLMSIVALGREIQLTGTRVAVVVDSGATAAFVMVSEGAVLLTGRAGVPARTIRAGRVAEFTSASPEVVETALADDLLINERFHSDVVFARPVPAGFSLGKALTTALVVGGAGVGGYFAYDKWIRKKDGSPFRTGTIVVRIPI